MTEKRDFLTKILLKTVLDRILMLFLVLEKSRWIEFRAIGELRYRRSACTYVLNK